MVDVYLDHGVATPLAPAVLAAMDDAARCAWASPSGLHGPASLAAEVLEQAREDVARLVAADPEDVVFTAGTTEARNLGVAGLWAAHGGDGRVAVLSAVEHPAVVAALDPGVVRTVGVDEHCLIHRDAMTAAIDDRTALVSFHHGQHEVGTLQDLDGLVTAARGAGPRVRIHVDACHTVGLVALDVPAIGADAVSFGGPAMGAPPWAGALWVRPGAGLHPRVPGGAQEHGKRAGAENLPAIAGMAAAARMALAERERRVAHMAELTERLAAGLRKVPRVRRNGADPPGAVPGHLQVSVAGVDAESLALAMAARGVAVSPGSACTADAGKASPTLTAMGLDDRWTRSALLFGVGEHTTAADIDEAVMVFTAAVASLRGMSPLAP